MAILLFTKLLNNKQQAASNVEQCITLLAKQHSLDFSPPTLSNEKCTVLQIEKNKVSQLTSECYTFSSKRLSNTDNTNSNGK